MDVQFDSNVEYGWGGAAAAKSFFYDDHGCGVAADDYYNDVLDAVNTVAVADFPFERSPASSQPAEQPAEQPFIPGLSGWAIPESPPLMAPGSPLLGGSVFTLDELYGQLHGSQDDAAAAPEQPSEGGSGELEPEGACQSMDGGWLFWVLAGAGIDWAEHAAVLTVIEHEVWTTFRGSMLGAVLDIGDPRWTNYGFRTVPFEGPATFGNDYVLVRRAATERAEVVHFDVLWECVLCNLETMLAVGRPARNMPIFVAYLAVLVAHYLRRKEFEVPAKLAEFADVDVRAWVRAQSVRHALLPRLLAVSTASAAVSAVSGVEIGVLTDLARRFPQTVDDDAVDVSFTATVPREQSATFWFDGEIVVGPGAGLAMLALRDLVAKHPQLNSYLSVTVIGSNEARVVDLQSLGARAQRLAQLAAYVMWARSAPPSDEYIGRNALLAFALREFYVPEDEDRRHMLELLFIALGLAATATTNIKRGMFPLKHTIFTADDLGFPIADFYRMGFDIFEQLVTGRSPCAPKTPNFAAGFVGNFDAFDVATAMAITHRRGMRQRDKPMLGPDDRRRYYASTGSLDFDEDYSERVRAFIAANNDAGAQAAFPANTIIASLAPLVGPLRALFNAPLAALVVPFSLSQPLSRNTFGQSLNTGEYKRLPGGAREEPAPKRRKRN
jgi:hypothetical protein